MTAASQLLPSSPYAGLAAYSEQDADFFFGREAERRIVKANFDAHPLTLVYGSSGVGKTSLLNQVNADLRARAKTNLELHGAPELAVITWRAWTAHDPMSGLADAVVGASREHVDVTADDIPGRALDEAFAEATTLCGELYLILDQLEEYFIYHSDDSEALGRELARALQRSDVRAQVLLAIREDSLARLDAWKDRLPSLFQNLVRIEHLDRESARAAIERPLDVWNMRLSGIEPAYEIEPALVDAVLEATSVGRLVLTTRTDVESSGARIEAPFLQLVVDRVWRATVEAGDHTLTLARLKALGGASRIVENHVDGALGRLTPEEQETAADCFRFLVSGSGTKIAQTASDLAVWARRPEPQVTPVLDKLCRSENGRILRSVAPTRSDESESYELFHDVLAGPILEWRRGYDHRRSQRLTRRRFLRLSSALLLLVTMFSVLAVWAVMQRDGAVRNGEASRSSRIAFSPDGRTLASAGANGTMRFWDVRTHRQLGRALDSHQGRVLDVAFSPDGGTLASGGSDGTVRLWDTRTHDELGGPLHGGGGAVLGVTFSPDGRTLRAANADGTVRVWNARTHAPIEQR